MKSQCRTHGYVHTCGVNRHKYNVVSLTIGECIERHQNTHTKAQAKVQCSEVRLSPTDMRVYKISAGNWFDHRVLLFVL